MTKRTMGELRLVWPKAKVMVVRSAVITACLLVALGALASCAREAAPPADQPVLSSNDDARAFTERFFASYVAGDAKAAVDMLCASDAGFAERARRFIERSQRAGSPYRVETFTIRSIGTHWIQREPYFRVEVSFPTKGGDGEVLHAYTLRAKDGCVDGFLDGGRPSTSSSGAAPGNAKEQPRVPDGSHPKDDAREAKPSPANPADEVIEL